MSKGKPQSTLLEPSVEGATSVLRRARHLDATGSVRLHIVTWTDASEHRALRVPLSDGLAGELVDLMKRSIPSTRKDLHFRPYDPGRIIESHEAAYLPTSDVPSLDLVLRTIEGNPLEDQWSHEHTEDAHYYIISIKPIKGDWVHTTREVSGSHFSLADSKKLLGIFKVDEKFVALDEQRDPLLLEQRVDSISSGRLSVILNQQAFDRSLGTLEAYIARGRATLELIGKAVRIKGFDEMAGAILANPKMLSKVRSIEARLEDPTYAALMTTPLLVEFVRANRRFGIQVVLHNGAECLEWDSSFESRWKILKLLDDDYLHSQRTAIDYETNSKSRA